MFMVPPTRRGGSMSWAPGRAGARPIDPTIGRNGTCAPGIVDWLESVRVVAPQVQIGLWEVVGEQAEARNDRRPSPTAGSDREQRQPYRVAGFGAVDGDRAGDRIDAAEIERTCIRGRRAGLYLWPPPYFSTSTSIVSPGSTVTTGARLLSQRQ